MPNPTVIPHCSNLGFAIRFAREGMKITLPALAKAARVSQGNLSKIENGKANITIATLYKLAGALDTTPQDLLTTAEAMSFPTH